MATTAPKGSYLQKLINLLIKRAGGTIKIPAADLMGDDLGEGFQVHFDQSTKELVLSFVPAGAKVYVLEESQTWLTADVLPQSRQSQPLTRDDLVNRVWTGSSATPTVEESRQRSPNKVVHLTNEGAAIAEVERVKAAALRALENYQEPLPSSRPQTRTTPSSVGREFLRP